ncbi:nitronate monooxygenase [Caldalkalibacillus salinus]|uniref:nitronate monooxygenase n=1 Tax=Caldalkalibacillus salinus TaxID=2803787 RepID=UPI001922FECE
MSLSLQNELTDVLGIAYPVVQAGMAGGPTTPNLVSAVSEAGGLGTLGGAYLSPEQLGQAIHAIRKQTSAPFAVNLFVAEESLNWSRYDDVRPVIEQIYEDLDKDEKDDVTHGNVVHDDGDNRHRTPSPSASTEDLHHKRQTFTFDPPQRPAYTFAEQFEVLLSAEVPVISTAFGVLPPDAMDRAKKAGLKISTMITSVEEAIEAERQGSDCIVAQGTEAGGHRGTFTIRPHTDGENIGLMSLVPQVVDQVSVPVIAAGGIMDGRGLVAALALGAQGVQLGTRFLTCQESGAHPAYQEALRQADGSNTCLTQGFSGRPARGVKNRFIQRWEASGQAPLPFPTQNTLTKVIRGKAAQQHNAEFMSLWAGQSVGMLPKTRNPISAAEIVDNIITEAKRLLNYNLNQN